MANLAEGILKQRSVAEESSYDTAQALVAGDAIKCFEDGFSIQPEIQLDEYQESVGTASLQNMRLGGRKGKWSVGVALATRGSSSPGAAPAWGDLATAAFGVQTLTPDTSVVYSLSDTVRKSLVLRERVSTYLYQEARGCWVESMELDFTQNQIPRLNFAGGFATYVWCYNPTLGAGNAQDDTVITLTSGHVPAISVGARVTIGTSTNSGAGHLVTAVSPSTEEITISPGLDNPGTYSSGNAIQPVWPTPSYVTNIPVAGTQSLLTISGTTLGVASAKINFATGLHGLDKTADRPNRIAGGARRVTFDFQCYYLDQDIGPVIGNAWGVNDAVTSRDIDLRLGVDSAGVRAKFSIPAGVLNVNPIEVPGSEETMINITGTAIQSAAALDEFVFTLD